MRATGCTIGHPLGNDLMFGIYIVVSVGAACRLIVSSVVSVGLGWPGGLCSLIPHKAGPSPLMAGTTVGEENLLSLVQPPVRNRKRSIVGCEHGTGGMSSVDILNHTRFATAVISRYSCVFSRVISDTGFARRVFRLRVSRVIQVAGFARHIGYGFPASFV